MGSGSQQYIIYGGNYLNLVRYLLEMDKFWQGIIISRVSWVLNDAEDPDSSQPISKPPGANNWYANVAAV